MIQGLADNNPLHSFFLWGGRGGAGRAILTFCFVFWWRRRAGQAAVPGRAELLASLDYLINLKGKPWIFSVLLKLVLLLVLEFLPLMLLLVLKFVRMIVLLLVLHFVLMIVHLLVLNFVLMIVLLLVENFVLSCFDILVLNFVRLIVLLFNYL